MYVSGGWHIIQSRRCCSSYQSKWSNPLFSPAFLFCSCSYIAALEHPDPWETPPRSNSLHWPQKLQHLSHVGACSPTPFTTYIVVVSVPTSSKGANEPDESNGWDKIDITECGDAYRSAYHLLFIQADIPGHISSTSRISRSKIGCLDIQVWILLWWAERWAIHWADISNAWQIRSELFTQLYWNTDHKLHQDLLSVLIQTSCIAMIQISSTISTLAQVEGEINLLILSARLRLRMFHCTKIRFGLCLSICRMPLVWVSWMEHGHWV